mgnify:CR=1 FL=1
MRSSSCRHVAGDCPGFRSAIDSVAQTGCLAATTGLSPSPSAVPCPGLAVRGLFIGDDGDCFAQAGALSLQVNVTILDEPPAKIVAYLDPDEFHSTWLGNKAIYRTRMAIADGGELVWRDERAPYLAGMIGLSTFAGSHSCWSDLHVAGIK